MDESSKSKRVETREFWQATIRLWAESHLSVRDFCSREGLTEHTFYSWRRRLMPESLACEVSQEPSATEGSESPADGRRRRRAGRFAVALARTRLRSTSCRFASSAVCVPTLLPPAPRREQQHRSRSSGHRPGACESWPASIRQPSLLC